jgi:signal transduction histidine kinase
MADAATATEKKDMLFSQGAHEIRNPISVILGYVRMLASERLGPLTDAQRKAVDEIGNSTGKLAGLADEMSSLARLLAGGAKFVRARVELAALIAAETSSVAALPDRHVGIRIIDDAPAATVTGDAVKLRTTFNSLMYSSRRELITSDELCVAIDRDTGGEQPAIRVSIGGADRIEELRRIPPSELAPLVEFRSGLGYRLSIARQVIEAHGGRIFSKTEPGPTTYSSQLIIGAMVFLPEA